TAIDPVGDDGRANYRPLRLAFWPARGRPRRVGNFPTRSDLDERAFGGMAPPISASSKSKPISNALSAAPSKFVRPPPSWRKLLRRAYKASNLLALSLPISSLIFDMYAPRTDCLAANR